MPRPTLDWAIIVVITLGPQCAAALILGDLLGHPDDPGEVVVVELTDSVILGVHSGGVLMAIVVVLWDLHSLKVLCISPDPKLAMTEVWNRTLLCRVPHISAAVSGDSSESSA